MIHFCNTFDDNNRSVSFGFVRFCSVSFGFVRFRSVSWKRATPLIPIVTNADATGGAKRNKKWSRLSAYDAHKETK